MFLSKAESTHEHSWRGDHFAWKWNFTPFLTNASAFRFKRSRKMNSLVGATSCWEKSCLLTFAFARGSEKELLVSHSKDQTDVDPKSLSLAKIFFVSNLKFEDESRKPHDHLEESCEVSNSAASCRKIAFQSKCQLWKLLCGFFPQFSLELAKRQNQGFSQQWL